jgi:hypothetical protein
VLDVVPIGHRTDGASIAQVDECGIGLGGNGGLQDGE